MEGAAAAAAPPAGNHRDEGVEEEKAEQGECDDEDQAAKEPLDRRVEQEEQPRRARSPVRTAPTRPVLRFGTAVFVYLACTRYVVGRPS